ncbi:MAG: DegT/DnrJ/EryC1/StrS family aminotransferase [Planctomycetota bacterium]|nr:DegT/DnrJ/EryC1/StrS family aminotransferase [Planctomycetota bacterium]
MTIPLLDLRQQYRAIKGEIDTALAEVFGSQRFILGPVVERFETSVAARLNTKYAIGVASGSDALLLGLMALGVGHGDEVITTPFSFFATAGAIARLGATPVFVDIEERGYNMCTVELEKYMDGHAVRAGKTTKNGKSRKRIAAIMPVHLYGQCCNMDRLMRLARKYRVPVIEDAAQAIAATFDGKPAGLFGDVGCFSFFPSKNLGAWGDGGLVTTQRARLGKLLKMLRVHGSEKRYYHDYVGINSRLDAIQAAVLDVKLRHLDQWMSARQRNADNYDRLITEAGIADKVIAPARLPKRSHVFHQYVVRCLHRDELRAYLKQNGVETEVYYPVPLHLQKCFKPLGYRPGSFPRSERASREVLALPMFPELTDAQQREVVGRIAEFLRTAS